MNQTEDNENISIFVSYSHQADSRWFLPDSQRPWLEEGLIPWLAAALQKRGVKLWYDRRELEYGDEFEQLICSEIEKAQCSILMVSSGFLTSNFINRVELPRIKDRVQNGEMTVIPILTEPCHWDEVELLSSRLVLPGQPRTLIDYIDSEREWRNVRFQILKAIEKIIEKIKTRGAFVESPEPPLPVKSLVNAHHNRKATLLRIAVFAMLFAIAFYAWHLKNEDIHSIVNSQQELELNEGKTPFDLSRIKDPAIRQHCQEVKDVSLKALAYILSKDPEQKRWGMTTLWNLGGFPGVLPELEYLYENLPSDDPGRQALLQIIEMVRKAAKTQTNKD
ncbi:MAG: toll/interleukin-1 receptor domain-containing protein [Candidatus Cloacimonetes bacterium]|nr:toll/interleukin-1 receptor domain-containing protein [Candidatus Cloacimonadota bacterium]